MTSCQDVISECTHDEKGKKRRRQSTALFASCGLFMALFFFAPRANAQGPHIVNCPNPLAGQALLTVPEIKSENGRLKALLVLGDNDKRVMWDSGSTPRCATQFMRFFHGRSLLKSGPEDPLFSKSDPIPGPTLRARVGDLIEVQFENLIDTQHFINSLDRGDGGCDITFAGSGKKSANLNTDKMPNCLHGSSTANVHFHGTHTTPSTTGDNVLLFIRPAVAPLPPDGQKAIDAFFTACEKNGSPSYWTDMPPTWQGLQKRWISYYDNTAPYKGQSPPQGGPPVLPPDMQLSPVNQTEIANRLWPQFHIGYFPYCFRIPAYDPAKVKMGQSPGTHWYHAHKHGSTALNVANGMTGAFIIEGKYDDDLNKFYKSNPNWKFQEQVLVIQQLTTVLNLTVPGGGPGSRSVPPLSVNGRLSPVITMQPNQVQLWRLINGAERDAALFKGFFARGSTTACTGTPTATCVHWKQTAQDGVQFKYSNYVGSEDSQINMAPANRADLLLQAPSNEGTYDLKVQAGLCRQNCASQTETLLTVVVKGSAISPAMPFISNESDFPTFPAFLADIPASDVVVRRDLVFHDNAPLLEINGKQFNDHVINQAMLLNSTEEWKVSNLDATKEHPFHIHVNPFQITEVFQPQSSEAKDPKSPCYADPTKPETWKPCHSPEKDFIWWDSFAIPASREDNLPSSVCTVLSACPANIQKYTSCTEGPNAACTVTIPGYYKMRSRFVDYPGQFVLHCHILTHEDRGMMELIEVVPDTTIYAHH
jgi:FtsP/CotA-like multicopper oxidase with cupredoxin domain